MKHDDVLDEPGLASLLHGENLLCVGLRNENRRQMCLVQDKVDLIGGHGVVEAHGGDIVVHGSEQGHGPLLAVEGPDPVESPTLVIDHPRVGEKAEGVHAPCQVIHDLVPLNVSLPFVWAKGGLSLVVCAILSSRPHERLVTAGFHLSFEALHEGFGTLFE